MNFDELKIFDTGGMTLLNWLQKDENRIDPGFFNLTPNKLYFVGNVKQGLPDLVVYQGETKREYRSSNGWKVLIYKQFKQFNSKEPLLVGTSTSDNWYTKYYKIPPVQLEAVNEALQKIKSEKMKIEEEFNSKLKPLLTNLNTFLSKKQNNTTGKTKKNNINSFQNIQKKQNEINKKLQQFTTLPNVQKRYKELFNYYEDPKQSTDENLKKFLNKYAPSSFKTVLRNRTKRLHTALHAKLTEEYTAAQQKIEKEKLSKQVVNSMKQNYQKNYNRIKPNYNEFVKKNTTIKNIQSKKQEALNQLLSKESMLEALKKEAINPSAINARIVLPSLSSMQQGTFNRSNKSTFTQPTGFSGQQEQVYP
jgi:hypothetical protein